MIKGKLLWFWIFVLVVSIVVGAAIASLKYDVSSQAIQRTLTFSGVALAILGRLFSKGNESDPVVSPKEKMFVSSLNALAGWSVAALVLGVVLGFKVLSHLDPKGGLPSGYGLLFLMVVYPAAVLIVYLMKRANIIKNLGC